MAGAASDQLYSILMDTPPEDERDDHGPREIGGVSPPNTLEIRWMPAAGGATTLVASAQGGRGVRTSRATTAIASTSRPTAASRPSRWMAMTAGRCSVSPASAPATTRRVRMTFACRRMARARSSASGQALHRHHAARRTRNGRSAHPGPGETSLPVKPMSLEGGDYLEWTNDGKAVTWAWGSQFFRQRLMHGAAEGRHRRRARALAPERLGAAERRASSR